MTSYSNSEASINKQQPALFGGHQQRRIKMTIGKEIKEYRKEYKLNQKEFAQMMGVSDVTICKWETGQSRPTEANLAKIRSFLMNKENQRQDLVVLLRPRRGQQTKELILITWKSGAMIAVDREQALDEILASFDDIEDIAVVDYRPAS
jgi:DNA-binding transcriptional regulator YiaG